MAISHAKPGEVIDVSPLGKELKNTRTATIVKTELLEVIRLVLPAGKEIKPHQVAGEITVQCLEGNVLFSTKKTESELTAGSFLYLRGSEEHAVRAVSDASLLVTILLEHNQGDSTGKSEE